MFGVNDFPTLEEFKIYLSDQRFITLTSALKSQFQFIIEYFRDKEFSEANFRAYLNKLRTENKFKNSTLNKYIRTGKLIARYMKIHVLDDFKSYRIMDADTAPYGDLISDHEMKHLSELRLGHDLKYRAALTLMRFSGMPPVDLCNLKWTDDKYTHFEYYRQKTGKHMLVPIVSQLRKMLDTLPHYNEYVFGSQWGRMKEQTLRDDIKKRVKYLKIPKHVTPYSFRYSMITWCYINAGEGMIPKIAQISGHSVDTAMKHYAKWNIKPLADALYATHPGLIKKAPIDTIKRTILNLLEHLVDISKYEIELIIKPKNPYIRHIHLS